MDYKSLGTRIRLQRKLCGLTQEKLASSAGISISFLGHIERGSRKASLDTLVNISNVMKVSPDVLLQDSLNVDLLGLGDNLTEKQRLLLNEIANLIANY